jgi:hypothetical protein
MDKKLDVLGTLIQTIVKNDLELKQQTKSSKLDKDTESCKSPKLPTTPCFVTSVHHLS